jgi:4-hydroxybenzoate polyprenyltransferase
VYAQLVRVPNLFTAVADIALGWLCATANGMPISTWPIFVVLSAASACLYSSGMVWNDFFDVEQDRLERPFRPIPSGRLSRRNAAAFGAFLLLAGLVLAFAAGCHARGLGRTPFRVASALAIMILLYDSWLKRTWAGPLGMGACRFLNVLLGFSVDEAEVVSWAGRVYLASVVGVYIAGVTWFARTEAKTSNRRALTAAAGIMLAALVLALAAPVIVRPADTSVLFPYLLVVLQFFIGFPIAAAINRPMPAVVQKAVKRSLVGLVALDAVLATAVAGAAGLLILLLLLPVLYLGRWIYST